MENTKVSEKPTSRIAWPSVNRTAQPLVELLLKRALDLRIGVTRSPQGAVIVDAGISHPGGVEAGRIITEICMGGLGTASIQIDRSSPRWPWTITVHSSNPALACLGSQYAGWSLNFDKFFSLGSGPARALAAREPLFAELGYRDDADTGTLVLEVAEMPPAALIDKVTRDCNLPADRLTIILTPTISLAGNTQVVGRVLEVALHKVHALHFPLDRVVDGMGSAPLPPPGHNMLAGMGRTNDAIIYGGTVQLFVTGTDAEASALAKDLPSSASRDYGKPFAEIFKAYKGDFYAIDAMLFSPAHVIVSNLETGRSFHAGEINPAMLDRCFGYEGG